ncbi:MAG TPA: hypothetical protein VM222_00660, partial [Planctomycetota bacterium]|nr:hypothetical protein [Planctomycetota bacterium]
MNDQEKAFARRMLETKRLSIEQVERIRVESERSGRPFRDTAVSLGLLPPEDPRPSAPPIKIQPAYLALLAASFVIFTGLLIASLFRMSEKSKKDDELALETERSRIEADRRAVEASRGYKKSVLNAKEDVAREQLQKARAAMIK